MYRGQKISGGVSGAHINPAVTLALAISKKFPWKKVPLYFLAQYLGAFLSSIVLYFIYLGNFLIDKGLTVDIIIKMNSRGPSS